MTTIESAPASHHLSESDIPFVKMPAGNEFRVLQVDADEGLWVVQSRFPAGFQAPTHRHTGPVWGYTVSGAWHYLEYPDVNRAGSFIFEPAGSVHTLSCLEDGTVAWFQMYGVNLDLDSEGRVERVVDGPGTLATYLRLCEESGHPRPAVLGT